MSEQLKGKLSNIKEWKSGSGQTYFFIDIDIGEKKPKNLCVKDAGLLSGVSKDSMVLVKYIQGERGLDVEKILVLNEDGEVSIEDQNELVEEEIIDEEVIDTAEASHVPEKKVPAQGVPKQKPQATAQVVRADGNRNDKHIDKRFIVNIQGNDFVTYNGLLDMATNNGLQGLTIVDYHIDWEKKQAHCIVIATFKDGRVFEGMGSASMDNVKANMQKNFVEMAHTRAKARALRDALNIDMCSSEEM